MAGLVAVKTMGRVSTHGLLQTHTHALTHTTKSHSFGAFHTYGKHKVHYAEGVAGGDVTQVTAAGFFHSSLYRCVSAAGTTSGQDGQ